MIKKYSKYIKILISLILITITIYKIDLNSLLVNLKNVNPVVFILIPVFAFMSSFSSALIKMSMFSIFNFNIKFIRLIKELLKGSFFGFFMPSVVGGDLYYIIRFGKDFNNYKKVTSGIFLIKIIGFLVFLSFVFAFGFYYWELLYIKLYDKIYLNNNLFTVIIIIAIIIIVSLVIILSLRKYLDSLKNKIMDNYISAKKILKNNKKIIILIVIFSIIFYIISLGSRVCLCILAGIELPIFQLAGIILIVNFLVVLPITVSGIGVRETSYITLLGIMGISAEQAIMLSLLDFLISISGVLTGGLLLLFDTNKKNINEKILKN